MRTAVITGASSGLGAELVAAAAKRFHDIECFWLMARNTEKLHETAKCLSKDKKAEIISVDLATNEGYAIYAEKLEAEKPDVVLLINAAGLGFLGNVHESTWQKQVQMVDVNVRGLTAVTTITLPYMERGGKIINISSIASFCPNPRMTGYSSTKAYVSSFGAGLNDELRKLGIRVTTVSPGPLDTVFLEKADIKGNSKMFEFLPFCDVKKTAEGAVKAAAKGRKYYTPKVFFKLYRVVAKIIPQGIMVKIART
ncbi:MAG: SDR family NAD(P)-dependent oxidoreductase [Ruminococcaceae bacterium]|nr:SDR family NAD(P)-dependent oxidoreductase [Oscillospiraceae bacterium]